MNGGGGGGGCECMTGPKASTLLFVYAIGSALCFNGDRLLGELTQVSSLRIPDTLPLLNIHRSKRWIIDRASLKQARSEDLQYVDSPEHIDFLNIYFANRKSVPVLTIEGFPVSAHACMHDPQLSRCWVNA